MMLSNYQSPFVTKLSYYKKEGLGERLPLFLFILLPISVMSLELTAEAAYCSFFQFSSLNFSFF